MYIRCIYISTPVVYMYVYIYIYINIHIDIQRHIHTYTYICRYMYTYTGAWCMPQTLLREWRRWSHYSLSHTHVTNHSFVEARASKTVWVGATLVLIIGIANDCDKICLANTLRDICVLTHI